MQFILSLLALLLAASAAICSPLVQARDKESDHPHICGAVVKMMRFIQDHGVENYCIHNVDAGKSTQTVVQMRTDTATITATPSTTTIFIPGNPPTTSPAPTPAPHSGRGLIPDSLVEWSLDKMPAKVVAKACSCLYVGPDQIYQTQFSTATVTATVTPLPMTKTVYPCATGPNGALPSPGPAYGDVLNPGALLTKNWRFQLSTPQGVSPASCCSACFFQVEDCLQAFWYSSRGCVVQQAVGEMGTGLGKSRTCPSGLFEGLRYGPDEKPAFRSSGNLVGGCGVEYGNF